MKTLIYLEENKLAPKGGPYAVGYYIKRRIQKLGIIDIEFLKVDGYLGTNVKDKNALWYKFFQKYYRIFVHWKRFRMLLNRGGYSPIDLTSYDVIHFHKTIDLFEVRKSLKDYKGKVVLTSHSPVPLSKEFLDEHITTLEKKLFPRLYSRLIEMDRFAFHRADYIHFPCEDAEDPYYNNWEEYATIHTNRKEHYVYIPTGIPKAHPKRCRAEVRNELHLKDTDFCISYVGRHNEVKGYDNLKKIGEKILAKENTRIIVAGLESPLTRLQHERWSEIGWTDDAHSYIGASDVFVLPNKETYFDIVMLEVLSLGRIVVASRTGGNKFFEKLKPNGVFLYDTVEEAVEILEKIKELSFAEREKLGQANQEMYTNNFTDEVFVNKYVDFLNSIK